MLPALTPSASAGGVGVDWWTGNQIKSNPEEEEFWRVRFGRFTRCVDGVPGRPSPSACCSASGSFLRRCYLVLVSLSSPLLRLRFGWGFWVGTAGWVVWLGTFSSFSARARAALPPCPVANQVYFCTVFI
jgi:hypothetical protein